MIARSFGSFEIEEIITFSESISLIERTSEANFKSFHTLLIA
jgi:hypothetical protein